MRSSQRFLHNYHQQQQDISYCVQKEDIPYSHTVSIQQAENSLLIECPVRQEV
jgi:hypothetical protein